MDETGNDALGVQSKDRGERKLLLVLLSAGFVALILGGVQIFSTIRKPFQATTTTNTTLGTAGAALSALTKTDTDGDGLNDYNELYVYQTSPYLADSDSDGASDSAEVSGGTDPNCVQGEACTPLAAINGATTNTNASFATNSTLTNVMPGTGQFSAEDIRKTLLNAGAPQATLDGLTDAELLELYNEVAGNTGTPETTNGAPTNTNTSTSVPDAETLKNLTPEQMREFLVEGGADRESLDNVDDATLKAIFEEAVNEVTTQ